MVVTVRTTFRNGTTFVILDGVGEADLLACIGDAVADALDDGPVVLDLTDVLLVNPAAVKALVDKLRVPALNGRLCVVSARLSARRMLRQFGDPSLALFPSAAAAAD